MAWGEAGSGRYSSHQGLGGVRKSREGAGAKEACVLARWRLQSTVSPQKLRWGKRPAEPGAGQARSVG